MRPLQTPCSLRIFVADGAPDGLRIVDRSNWLGGSCAGVPACGLGAAQRRHPARAAANGRVPAAGPREDGEGDPIKQRLVTHFNGFGYHT